MPAAEFLILKVQIISGAEHLQLFFSPCDNCFFRHYSYVQMALLSMALNFEIEIIAISFGKLSQGLLQSFCMFGEADPTPGIGPVGIHPAP